MTTDSVVSLLPVAAELFSHAIPHLRHLRIDDDKGNEVEPPSRLIPKKWVISGLIVSVAGGTLIIWYVFGYEGIKPWATLFAFFFGGMTSLLG